MVCELETELSSLPGWDDRAVEVSISEARNVPGLFEEI